MTTCATCGGIEQSRDYCRSCGSRVQPADDGAPTYTREDMARAWAQGHRDGCDDAIDGWCDHESRNPYRASIGGHEDDAYILHCDGCGEDYNVFAESHVGHVA